VTLGLGGKVPRRGYLHRGPSAKKKEKSRDKAPTNRVSSLTAGWAANYADRGRGTPRRFTRGQAQRLRRDARKGAAERGSTKEEGA